MPGDGPHTRRHGRQDFTRTSASLELAVENRVRSAPSSPRAPAAPHAVPRPLQSSRLCRRGSWGSTARTPSLPSARRRAEPAHRSSERGARRLRTCPSLSPHLGPFGMPRAMWPLGGFRTGCYLCRCFSRPPDLVSASCRSLDSPYGTLVLLAEGPFGELTFAVTRSPHRCVCPLGVFLPR